MTRKENLSFVWIEIENVHLVGFALAISLAVTLYKPGGRGRWRGGGYNLRIAKVSAVNQISRTLVTLETRRSNSARATHEADIHT